MAAMDKVRILVVGDSGVGKTSLVHLICKEESISNPAWSIGCTVEVKPYDYREGLPGMKTFFLEFWDVGGSANHENSRSIFYNSINGLILVHDLTNRKSFVNLRRWLAEVLNAGKDNGGSGAKLFEKNKKWYDFSIDIGDEYDPEQFAGNQIPIIVIGTKLDQAGTARMSKPSRGLNLVEEIGADMFNLDCRDAKQFKPESVGAKKLSHFFDKVIEGRFYTRDVPQPQQLFGLQESQKYFDRSAKRKMV